LEEFKSLIAKSFLYQCKEPPEGSKLLAIALAWDDLLKDVETHKLQALYTYTLKTRAPERQAYVMTATEMRFVVDQRRKGLIFAKGQWLDSSLYNEDGLYDPKRLVM
jgi:hypothetical protein